MRVWTALSSRLSLFRPETVSRNSYEALGGVSLSYPLTLSVPLQPCPAYCGVLFSHPLTLTNLTQQ